MSHIVVIGAGQAGSSLTAKLRELGFEGDITLIGDETAPPYQRPPLSKKYLMGEMDVERLYLRPRSFYDDQRIALRLGGKTDAIDTVAKTLSVDGEDIAYDQLALTTGSSPRKLPAAIGGALGGIYVVRNIADVDAMAASFTPGKRVLVVGGGYIGLEAAAVTSKLGLEVTLVEMADRILQRVACPETSDYFRDLHQKHGVKILENTGLDGILGNKHVTGATLSNGQSIDVDFVIAGVGVTPNADLAEAAGLDIDNGIKTNALGQTSDPSIWAAGDCASFPWDGGRIRLESVQNAIDQAELIAENMLGAGKDYRPYPWFWSDQYDVKLQIAGLNTGYDNVVTRPGDKDGAVSHWYYRGETLLAVDAMNDPRAYMVGKRLIEAGKSPAASEIMDQALVLKDLLKP